MTDRPLRSWPAVAAIAAVTVAAYAPSFTVPFQFDDFARIGENTPLQEGRYLDAVRWLGNSRLIPSLTVVANYGVGGFDVGGYHAVNLAIHLLATLGVFQLALAVCRTPRLRDAWPPERARTLAVAAALIFACHPLQTQAVTYIVQRYASMAAMFYVWAVVCYVRARNRRRGTEPGRSVPYYGAAGLLAVCAVLSKENAASLPVAVVLTEWVFFSRGWSRRTVVGAIAVLAAGIGLPAALKIAMWTPMVPEARSLPWMQRLTEALFQTGGAPPTPSSIEYFFTQCTVVPRYLRLVALPWGLNVDHDVPVAPSLSVPVVAGFAFLAALIAFGFAAARRWPLVGYGVLWLFVALSVESSVLPITDTMMEHRMYLAMPGVALVAGALFARAAERAPRAAAAAGVGAALVLISLTYARNQVWQTPLSLWLDAAEKSPHKARVHVNVGVAYHGLGRLDDAVEHYCRAIKLDSNIALARDNLEIALEQQGRYDEVLGRLVGPHIAKGAQSGSVIIEVDVADSYCR